MLLLSGGKSACIRSDSVYGQIATGMFFIRLSGNTGRRFFLWRGCWLIQIGHGYPGQLDQALDTVLEPGEQAAFAR